MSISAEDLAKIKKEWEEENTNQSTTDREFQKIILKYKTTATAVFETLLREGSGGGKLGEFQKKYSEKVYHRLYDNDPPITSEGLITKVEVKAGPRQGKKLVPHPPDAVFKKVLEEFKDEIQSDDKILESAYDTADQFDKEALRKYVIETVGNFINLGYRKLKDLGEDQISKVKSLQTGVFDVTSDNESINDINKYLGGRETLTTNPGISIEEEALLAKETRISEQAALILTIEEILSKVKLGGNGQADVYYFNKKFKNFSPIIYDSNISDPAKSSTSTGHFSITNFFTKHPSMQTFFKGMPPQIMSFLVPSIKLYKTFYPVDKNNKNVSYKDVVGYDWRIPFDDVPFYFEKETSKFVAQEPESILKGNGSFHGVGIKSFSYTYKGTNPAEVNTNITAKLEIFFQNPAELVRPIDVDWSEMIGNASDAQQNNYQAVKFSYSDLINQASVKLGETDDRFNDQYYRIKVECGYAEPNIEILKDLLTSAGITEGDEQQKYITAIKSTKTVMYLSPYKYDLSFKDGGGVSLNIEFISSMDSMLASPEADLFKLTPEAKNLEELTKRYEEFIKARKDEQKPTDNTKQQDVKESTKRKELIEKFKKEFPTIATGTDEQILEKLNNDKIAAYNGLYELLIGAKVNTDYNADPRTIFPKFYKANFKSNILGVRPKTNPTDAKKKIERRVEAFNDGNQINFIEALVNDAALNDNEIKTPLATQTQTTTTANTTTAPATTGTSVTPADEALTTLDQKTLQKLQSSEDNHIIKFVFLGDILDVALNCLNDIKPIEESPKVAIGNIPFYVPTKKTTNEQGRVSKYDEAKLVNPNLAHIPVALPLFQEFLLKNVVKSKKTRYPILQFIKDLLSELIFPAISPTILGDRSAINAKIRFSTSYISFPSNGGLDPISGKQLKDRIFPPIIDNEKINNIRNLRDKGAFVVSSSQKEKLKSANYIFIVCSSVFPSSISGQQTEEQEVDNGILHFRMGTETGIIKNVSFKTMPIPHLRESIAHREGNQKGTSLKQYYNSDVTLFGNDIFKPGDFIYIHPNYMFISRRSDGTPNSPATIDLEDELGIGGYYLVLDVNTSFSDMKYETKLTCAFQAKRKKGGGVITIHDDDDQPSRG